MNEYLFEFLWFIDEHFFQLLYGLIISGLLYMFIPNPDRDIMESTSLFFEAPDPIANKDKDIL